MNTLNGIPVAFSFDVPLRRVYRGWDKTQPDAVNDVISFINSVLATACTPIGITVLDGDTVRFIFPTWRQYREAQLILDNVLDLLWLVDDVLKEQ